jgi:DNA-binding HxlR family transcriptional regulator
MLGRTREWENCYAARALEIVGERRSLLIIRSAMFGGATRFTELRSYTSTKDVAGRSTARRPFRELRPSP